MDRLTLNVQMLGGFSVSYCGRILSLERNGTTKAMQLLQLLLVRGSEGISRTELQQLLYGRDEVSNPANNLKVTVFRLRKLLAGCGLPEDDYVCFHGGRYFWGGQLEIQIDAFQFRRAAEEANAAEEEEQLPLLKRACWMYRGEFLPMLEAEDWVCVTSVQCRDLYFSCLEKLCAIMSRRREYDEELELCEAAANIYPYEEHWQLQRIDCMMALNRYREALQIYDEVNNLFRSELGIGPSEQMLQRFRTMSDKVRRNYAALEDIKQLLCEKNVPNGAYYSSYPSFIDCYRVIVRIIERTGQSVFLMLCGLNDLQGNPLESGERLDAAAELLRAAVRSALRHGDIYTRYSPSQFVVMLMGANQENCSIVSERIQKKFGEEGGVRGVRLHFDEISAADVLPAATRVTSFGGNQW